MSDRSWCEIWVPRSGLEVAKAVLDVEPEFVGDDDGKSPVIRLFAEERCTGIEDLEELSKAGCPFFYGGAGGYVGVYDPCVFAAAEGAVAMVDALEASGPVCRVGEDGEPVASDLAQARVYWALRKRAEVEMGETPDPVS